MEEKKPDEIKWYKDLIERLRNSTKIEEPEIYLNEERKEALIPKIDCSLKGQFMLSDFKIIIDRNNIKEKTMEYSVDYNYKHKGKQLIKLSEAVNKVHKYIYNLFMEEKKGQKKQTAKRKVYTDEGYIAQAVNSIIFSLCESARMDCCFEDSIALNSENSKSITLSDEDFYGLCGAGKYIKNYESCHKLIYCVGPTEERHVLTKEDFEMFQEYHYIDENIRICRQNTLELFNNIINNIKKLKLLTKKREEVSKEIELLDINGNYTKRNEKRGELNDIKNEEKELIKNININEQKHKLFELLNKDKNGYLISNIDQFLTKYMKYYIEVDYKNKSQRYCNEFIKNY